METTLLQTKLFVPPARAERVSRPRLAERLDAGSRGKLTLVSAPAGFGKTTLVGEWVGQLDRPVAWLSLDESDNDPTRFLTYFVAALQTVQADIGKGALSALQSPQPPPVEAVLTGLINEISAIPNRIVFVLDDYHLVNAQSIHDALAFLLRRLPPQLHLIITTREDPPLQLARLRARGQLIELRATDLCFTSSEAVEFLNRVMGLDLSPQDVAALETRTEGWIAGLQLAAVSMQGRTDTSSFIESFTGSHRHVLDYLVEEVLEQQSESVQTFLLQTSILDRLTGPLCDAVRFGEAETRTGQDTGQAILEYLDQANLFVVPLDNERRWYRYHHLFADLLRQQMRQIDPEQVPNLHNLASAWYEAKGMLVDAFYHATAAGDIERAARLIEGEKLPVHLRSVVTPILAWLESLPKTMLDAYPSLWVERARMLLALGQTAAVEENLQAAEASLAAATYLPEDEWDEESRDLLGQMASLRATVAFSQHRADDILIQSRRALQYLHSNNLYYRASTSYKMGYAYQLQGDRAAAKQAYVEALSTSQKSGSILIQLLASGAVGEMEAAATQLFQAAETFQNVLNLFADQPLPIASASHLGLARIFYEWNELDKAQKHGEQALELARQYESNVDVPISCQVILVRIMLARGDTTGALKLLAQADRVVREKNFVLRVPEVTAAWVEAFLRQGDIAAAVELTRTCDVPLSEARVYLAQGDAPAVLAILGPLREQMEAKNWIDEQLKVMALQAVAYQVSGDNALAFHVLREVLSLAEPGGYIRTFVDEGPPMGQLLYEALSRGIAPDYVQRLLSAFPIAEPEPVPSSAANDELIEPLSERELEVVHLIAEGLTNPEIAARLFLSPHTVKAHARNIYGKLNVHNRTQAVARARALGILSTS
jgi:LuxR family maltose regulon positive regulatory protein